LFKEKDFIKITGNIWTKWIFGEDLGFSFIGLNWISARFYQRTIERILQRQTEPGM
jgi:hypothetical protein